MQKFQNFCKPGIYVKMFISEQFSSEIDNYHLCINNFETKGDHTVLMKMCSQRKNLETKFAHS
jgi:hypothetical protein